MITVFHYNSLTTEERNRLNSSDGGWGSEPRFSRYADITTGFGEDDKVRKAVGFAWMAGEYTEVAKVMTDNLERAFESTQHINENWLDSGIVYEKLVEKARSTSVGDVLKVSRGNYSDYYIVAGMGFTKVRLLDEAFGINSK